MDYTLSGTILIDFGGDIQFYDLVADECNHNPMMND